MAVGSISFPNKPVYSLPFVLPLLSLAMAVRMEVVGEPFSSKAKALRWALVGAAPDSYPRFSLPRDPDTVAVDMITQKANPL